MMVVIVCVGVGASAFGVEQAKQELRAKRVLSALNDRLQEQDDESARQVLSALTVCWDASLQAKTPGLRPSS